MYAIVWLVLFVAFISTEALTLGLAAVWFAGGSLIAFLLAILDVPLLAQIIAFLLVSLVLLYFTRPIALKYVNNRRILTNADSLVGKVILVKERIDNLAKTGTAVVNGAEWTVRSTDDAQVFEEGTKVKVSELSGVKLIVEAADKLQLS